MLTDAPGLAPVRLTEWTSCGGCAAKWGAGELRGLVAGLAGTADPALLVGLAPFDDAAVFRLTDDVALVSTIDFFPPPVDDPADFGAVAAANACSDVFAMGGRVRLAVNVAAFPERLPVAAIEAILAAAADTVAAAGGVVAGGHTIRSDEPLFGLAVQGTVHPDAVWTKGGARGGDALVLSKPLGTGIVLAGDDAADRALAIGWMRRLNRDAAEQLAAVDGGRGPHACTDVTGYGLLGHAWEMAERSEMTVRIESTTLPLHQGAGRAAAAGVRTGGDARNRAALAGFVAVDGEAAPALEALAYDPQTSGGLLAAVAPGDAARLADEGWWVIGEVLDGPPSVQLR
ncbi:MAG: selenide, water dikinase SelD [Acidimicrobiia bacterium]|nr:selenide, water dikinase SelD [Acidimicrobiia bacterium]